MIACATKQIPYDWTHLQRMERDEAESGLDFIGFIVFENKLKPATAATIEELSQAGIRQVMCTGDNILTAISVARESCLVDRTAHCFVARFAEGTPAVVRSDSLTDLVQAMHETLMPVSSGRASTIHFSRWMKGLSK